MFAIPPFSSSSSSSSPMAAAATPSPLDLIVQAAAQAALTSDVPMGQKSSKRKLPPNGDASIILQAKKARLSEAAELFSQAMKLVKHDDAQAIRLLEQTLALGYIRAQKHLAFACIRMKKFSDAAKYSLMILKRRESASSLHNLAMFYHKGDGVAQDDSIAWEYVQRAAVKKHPSSLVWMARRYEEGMIIKNQKGQVVKVIAKDLEKAIELYEQAAELGHKTAQEHLAQIDAMQQSD